MSNKGPVILCAYLQHFVILGHKTHASLKLIDSQLEVTPRLCGVGQVEGGVTQALLEVLILISEARFNLLAVDQEVL